MLTPGIPLYRVGEALRSDKFTIELTPFLWEEYTLSAGYSFSVELEMVSLYTVPCVFLEQVIEVHRVDKEFCGELVLEGIRC